MGAAIPRGHLAAWRWAMGALGLKMCPVPLCGVTSLPNREEGVREETPPHRVSSQKLAEVPTEGAQHTSAAAGGRWPTQRGWNTQKRVSRSLHSSPRPLVTASRVGAPGIWELICTPSTRPARSQRRGPLGCHTKDSCRRCRLLPAPPLPALAPPGCQPRHAPRGTRGFPSMPQAAPCLLKDSLVFPPQGSGFPSRNKGRTALLRGLATTSHAGKAAFLQGTGKGGAGEGGAGPGPSERLASRGCARTHLLQLHPRGADAVRVLIMAQTSTSP